MRFFYFPVEIPSREIPLRLEIVSRLRRRFPDAKFLVAHHLILEHYLDTMPPGVILYKDFSPWRAKKYLVKSKASGHEFTAIDEEGLYFFSDSIYRRRVSKFVLEKSEKIFIFGEIQKNALSNLLNKKITSKVGFPKYETPSFISAPKEIRILINSKYTSANISKAIKDTFRVFRLSFGLGYSFAKLLPKEVIHDRFMREHFTALYKLLLVKGYQVRFRPHPGESARFYLEQQIEISDRSLEADMEWATIVIHSGCTTGLEALARGKIAINFEAVKALSEYRGLPNLGSIRCATSNDVTEVLAKTSSELALIQKNVIDQDKWQLESLMGVGTIGEKIDAIAEELGTLSKQANGALPNIAESSDTKVVRKYSKKFSGFPQAFNTQFGREFKVSTLHATL